MTTAATARFQHPGALKEAQRLIQEALDTGATHLDLNNLRLRFFPEELSQLAGQLKTLDISECEALTSLAGIEQFTQLIELNMSGCHSLTTLEGVEKLVHLIGLDISYCAALTNLTAVKELCHLTTLKMSACDGLTSLEGIEKLSLLTTLDISWCDSLTSLQTIETLTQLTTLAICGVPTPLEYVEKLDQLTSLDLSGCNELINLTRLNKLTKLMTLDISGCEALISLEGITLLPQLTKLNIDWCRGLTSLAGAETLAKLTTLKISECQVLTGQEGLEKLTQLTTLEMSFCEALVSLEWIEQLNLLSTLDISGCQVLTNLAAFEKLTQLTTLNISNCQTLTSLAGIENFTRLTELDISRCQGLSSLHELETLTQLKNLNISGSDALTNLENIKTLTQLTALHINNCNELTSLVGCESLVRLKTLRVIGCAGLDSLVGIEALTELTSLAFHIPINEMDTTALLGLNKLEKIFFTGATLCLKLADAEQLLLTKPRFRLLLTNKGTLAIDHVPTELTRAFKQTAFENWRFECERTGKSEPKQLKVMLLGNGRIGKTQLARRLRGDSFDETIPSTHGIQLHTVSWPQLFGTQGALPPHVDPAYADVQLHCWDFGGQDVYLGTHSLFLDSQAVYLLLWHPGAENNDQVNCETLKIHNRPLSYWLAYLKSLVGAQANILVCQSQCDTPDQHRNAPVPNPPPFKALRPLDISSKTNDGLDQFYPTFKRALQQQLQSNGEVWLPNCWLAVEQDIRQLILTQPKLKQLPYADFVALCNKHQVTAPATLANYLHQSGLVFYRLGHFNNQLILDQQWALQGVYLLLDRQTVLPELQASKGRFTKSMLQRWLQLQQLDKHDLPLFLEMMQQCGACFKVNDTEDIAPDNLPEFDANEADQRWQDATSEFEIELTYEFLHDATMRYLLSKIGDVAKEHAYYWRYGCCFFSSKHKAKVWFECKLLTASAEQIANYSQPGVIVIRVAGGQGAELTKHLIESIAEVCHLGQLPEVRWVKGQATKAVENQSERVKPTPFSDIGPAAPPPPKQPSVYFSYAWGKESEARQQISDQILLKLKAANYQVFRDKESTSLGDSIDDFERRIGRSDFALIILSHKYLYESLHCMKELALLYERSQRQQYEFTYKVIPVVMADVNIDNHTERLKIVRKWQLQMEELQTLVNEVGTESAGTSSVAELTMMRSVVNCCADALSWISDLITERQAELQVDATVQLVKKRISSYEKM